MEQPTIPAPNLPAIRHLWLLPYWAVWQTDVRQTLRSWVYLLWVVVTVLAAVGYIVYRVGLYREAGLIQSASVLTADLLRWMVLGSLSLIVVLTVSSISSERGNLADSVLCRGISRHQYFLAKLHARWMVILVTFLVLAVAVLLSFHFLLGEELSFDGSIVAVLLISAILWTIIAWGVTIGALSNSTVMGIAVFWILLYGCGFLVSLLPAPYPSPERLMKKMPPLLRGQIDFTLTLQLLLSSAILTAIAIITGLIGFSRRDV